MSFKLLEIAVHNVRPPLLLLRIFPFHWLVNIFSPFPYLIIRIIWKFSSKESGQELQSKPVYDGTSVLPCHPIGSLLTK